MHMLGINFAADKSVPTKRMGLQGIEWVILRDHSGGKACG
jgi:hypothetical protein